MRIAIRLLLGLGGLLLVIWLWGVFFPGPEKIIRKRLRELEALVSFPANQPPLANLTAVQQICARVTPDVEIRVDVRGVGRGQLQGRDHLREALLGFRSTVNGAKVELLDVGVRLAPDKQSAEVSLTAKARTPRDPDTQFQELKIIMRHQGGHWLVAQVETVKTLR